ncbi:colicin-like pore-forming protein [Erwinia sp. P6884]|uniref:colicin-like pore-forming protein n=1 Tax=Erwinia sp. P6884 TaxID=3141450 RepID=UPI00318EC8C1
MPGFSYGGLGDGTNWSSERGDGPALGGGSTGNSGNNNASSWTGTEASSPALKQIIAVQRDSAFRTKLGKMLVAARQINPSAKFSIARISPDGIMVLVVTGLNAEQGKKLGLTGLVMGFSSPGLIGVVGDIDTGHRYTVKTPQKNSLLGDGNVDSTEFFSGKLPNVQKNYKNWQFYREGAFSYTGQDVAIKLLRHLTYSTVNGTDTYTLHYMDKGKDLSYKVIVRNGDLNNMAITANGNMPSLLSVSNAKKTVQNFAPLIKESEKETILKASEVIISAGDKAGNYLGNRYSSLARELSGNIRNFQGKTIRNYEEALESLNKLLANPNLKINAADKSAIINAWQVLNADDLSNKFSALGKTFKVADYAIKANNVKEKSIEGYKTGNWGPLLREVEAWVVGGIASSVALAIFSATVGGMLVLAGVPAVAVGILGIMMAAIIGAMIDDKFINKLNSEIISSAH